MDFASVFQKTSIGQDEVAAKSGALNHSERRILILADGKRSVGELDKFVRPGEIAPIMETLLRGRYLREIEPSAENNAFVDTRPAAVSPVDLGMPTVGGLPPAPPAQVVTPPGPMPVAPAPSAAVAAPVPEPIPVPAPAATMPAPAEPEPLELPEAGLTMSLPAAGLTSEIARLEVVTNSEKWSEAPAYIGGFSQLKQTSAEELLQRCGFFAEVLAARILTCSTPKALRALLREIEFDIEEHLGTEAALEFVKRVGSKAVELS